MLRNNTPADSYIYIEGLSIIHGDTVYTINNKYTNQKYVYWNLNNPRTLETYDIRQDIDNLILIIKNDNGEAYEMKNLGITLSYEGLNNKILSKKINAIDRNSGEYKTTVEELNTNVSTLSDELVKTSTFNQIKETFNTSTVQLNNKLTTLTSLLRVSLSDNILTTAEKGNINYEHGLFNQLSVEVLAQADSLVEIYKSNSEVNEDNIALVNTDIAGLSSVIAELSLQINELVNLTTETVTLDDTISIQVNLSSVSNLLVSLKNNCNNLIYLGVGNTIVDTTNDLSYRIEKVEDIIEELQENVSSGYEEEKRNIQSIINSMISYTNKMNNALFNALRDNDGTISGSLYSTIHTYKNNLRNDLNKLKGIFDIYYSNDALSYDIQVKFYNTYLQFKKAHEDLSDFIDTSLQDNYYTYKEYDEFISYLKKYREKRSNMSSQFMSVINLVINSQNASSVDVLNSRIDAINEALGIINQTLTTIQNKLTELENRIIVLEG